MQVQRPSRLLKFVEPRNDKVTSAFMIITFSTVKKRRQTCSKLTSYAAGSLSLRYRLLTTFTLQNFCGNSCFIDNLKLFISVTLCNHTVYSRSRWPSSHISVTLPLAGSAANLWTTHTVNDTGYVNTGSWTLRLWERLFLVCKQKVKS